MVKFGTLILTYGWSICVKTKLFGLENLHLRRNFCTCAANRAQVFFESSNLQVFQKLRRNFWVLRRKFKTPGSSDQKLRRKYQDLRRKSQMSFSSVKKLRRNFWCCTATFAWPTLVFIFRSFEFLWGCGMAYLSRIGCYNRIMTCGLCSRLTCRWTLDSHSRLLRSSNIVVGRHRWVS